MVRRILCPSLILEYWAQLSSSGNSSGVEVQWEGRSTVDAGHVLVAGAGCAISAAADDLLRASRRHLGLQRGFEATDELTN